MNLNHWISEAREHWKEHRPTYFKDLRRTGQLRAALRSAAEATYREMSELEEAGYSNQEAWEMVREQYLFPPGEPEQEEIASKGVGLFTEINALHSEILQSLHNDQTY